MLVEHHAEFAEDAVIECLEGLNLLGHFLPYGGRIEQPAPPA
jgi:hypothetical protein